MIQELYTYVSSLLAEIIAGRIYPDNLPEKPVYPAIVYTLESDDPDYLLDGTPIGTHTSQVQFEIVGKDAAEVDFLGRTIDRLLNGYRGKMGGEPLPAQSLSELAGMSLADLVAMSAEVTEGITALVRRTNDSQTSTAYDDGGDTWLYIRQQDYSIRWKNL